ncbi:hypothetical protein IW294_01975 [Streptomyces olivaceus]|nr:hypothetical protein [Streptomyces olivaceus]
MVFTGSTGGGGRESSGGFTPAGDWTPPACWYEPKWTPAEFAEEFRKSWDIPHASGVGEAYRLSQDHYINGEPYEDFNKEKTGKGIWWESVRDEDRAEAGDPAAFACDARTFWVDNGEAPEVENAVTPEILAQLAYSRIKVPDTSVTLAPGDATKVNLPTWAWLDNAEFDEVSVTASLDVGGVNIQATTTATPVALKLEPGTPDAETYPASGECTINADGSIGEPYAKGKADQTPPCGIKYLRSSGNGAFDLQATITWDIAWTGTGGAGGDLPDGTFGTTQAVTVQEIQAVNR